MPSDPLDHFREVSGRAFGPNFRSCVRRNHLVGNSNLPHHVDSRSGEGVGLQIAHRHPAVDATDTQSVQRIDGKLLKAHVVDAGNLCGALEIGFGTIPAASAYARVVDRQRHDFAQSAPFLPVVDDDGVGDARALSCTTGQSARRCRCWYRRGSSTWRYRSVCIRASWSCRSRCCSR